VLNVVDCPVDQSTTSHSRFGEGRENLAKHPSHACMEIRASLVRSGMVCVDTVKMMMMMFILIVFGDMLLPGIKY